MASFTYKASDSQSGKIVQGDITAKTLEEAGELVAKKGLVPISVRPMAESFIVKGTIPLVEKITFCRYMSIMMSTGLSISEGIDVLSRETKNVLMKKILSDMSYSLEQGQDLSAIFERYPGVFESYFLTLIKAGEVSGKLAEVFKYLESELRADYSLNAKVKGAMMYPMIVVSAMIAIGMLMFFFVLPQIGRVFLNMKLPLAAPTKFLFETSVYLSKYFVHILISGLILAVLGFLSLKRKAVRDMIMRMVRPIPFIRSLLIKIDLARFNRILSTLLRSAVPITEALEISFATLAWPDFRNLASSVPDEVKKGKSLSAIVKEHNVFPSLVVQMMAAGEKTGTLDATLSDLATFYEQEVEEEVKGLTQIIEPVLMLVVGIAVGAMILSIIAPIYSVVGNFQSAAGSPGGIR